MVDINRLVRIVQFMHTVYSVWMPEAILFYLFINFYRDNYILSAVYLLVLMNLNLDKLVKSLLGTCYHFLIHDTNTLIIQIISLKILPKFTK